MNLHETIENDSPNQKSDSDITSLQNELQSKVTQLTWKDYEDDCSTG